MKKICLYFVVLLLFLSACTASNNVQSEVMSSPPAEMIPTPTPEPRPTPRPYDYSEEELAILALANNTTPRDQLVKTIYSQAKLHDLQYYLSKGRRKLTELNEAFPIECLRQTEAGYYAVYLGEDGKTAFAFLEKDPLRTWQVLVLEPLTTKQEFLEFVSQGVTRSEMMAADPNIMIYESTSGIIQSTKHLVQEGAFYMDYLFQESVSDSKFKIDTNAAVSKWQFLSEEDLLQEARDSQGKDNVALITGYILPLDKQPLPGQDGGHLEEKVLPYYPDHQEVIQKVDNQTPSDQILTRVYSEEEIETLRRNVTNKPSPVGQVAISRIESLQEDYPVECLRELPRRFYAVYQCENGKKAYVFIDKIVGYRCNIGQAEQIELEQLSLWVGDCKIMGPFHTRQEFDAFLAQSPTLGEIQAFDPDGNTYSTNVQAITSHNVKEGVYVLTFNFQQGATDPSQWVLDPEKTKFYTNEEVETQRITPYAPHALLGIDKE